MKVEEARAIKEIRADANFENKTSSRPSSKNPRDKEKESHSRDPRPRVFSGDSRQSRDRERFSESRGPSRGPHGEASRFQNSSAGFGRREEPHVPLRDAIFDKDQISLMDLLKTSKKHEPQTRSTHAVTLPIKTTISPPAPTTEMPPEKLTSLLEEYFELQDLDSTVKEFVDYVVNAPTISEALCCALLAGSEKSIRTICDLILALSKSKRSNAEMVTQAIVATTPNIPDIVFDVPFAIKFFGLSISTLFQNNLIQVKDLVSGWEASVKSTVLPVPDTLILEVITAAFEALRSMSEEMALKFYDAVQLKKFLNVPPEHSIEFAIYDFLKTKDLLFLDLALQLRIELMPFMQTIPPLSVNILQILEHHQNPQNLPTQKIVARSLTRCFALVCLEKVREGSVTIVQLTKPLVFVLRKGIGSAVANQHVALREIQLVFYEASGGVKAKFASELLYRLFIVLYDQEVISEDAFMFWKDDVDDSVPGKI